MVVSSFDQVELWQEVRFFRLHGVRWWTNEECARLKSAATFEKGVLKKSLTHLDTQAAQTDARRPRSPRYLTQRASCWRSGRRWKTQCC